MVQCCATREARLGRALRGRRGRGLIRELSCDVTVVKYRVRRAGVEVNLPSQALLR